MTPYWNIVPVVSTRDMATRTTQRTERRADALNKARIVDAAIRILDSGGEDALTFRALAASLATGSGAIYWHVADKSELLAAGADQIVADVLSCAVGDAEPVAAIRAIALGVFDAIDAHPWVGRQLFREPWRPAMLQILEGVGGPLQAHGVPQHALFDAASALIGYILGVAAQNAANACLARETERTDRSTFLADVAARWSQLDAAEYPFVRQMAAQLRDHDDRQQFLAGVDLIMAGVGTVR